MNESCHSLGCNPNIAHKIAKRQKKVGERVVNANCFRVQYQFLSLYDVLVRDITVREIPGTGREIGTRETGGKLDPGNPGKTGKKLAIFRGFWGKISKIRRFFSFFFCNKEKRWI